MGDITGKINETRRTFQAETGETGTVHFGRTHTGGGNGRGSIVATPVTVTLADGRQAFGRYHNAGNVRLTLKAIYTRAGKRLDKHH